MMADGSPAEFEPFKTFCGIKPSPKKSSLKT